MNNIEFMPSKKQKIDVLRKKGSQDAQFSMHLHNNYEIYFSLSNGNKFCVGQKFYDANRNDVFLFNNTDIHKIIVSDSERYERYVVMFAPSLFPKSDSETAGILDCFNTKLPSHSHKISLTDGQAKQFLQLLDNMNACDGVSHAELKRKLYLMQLLLFIGDVKQTSAQNGRTENDDPRLNLILEYIRTHCAFPITLDELSREFYLNKYYLCRMFKTKLGFGISEYIESCRLSNALPLLREGTPVSTVALKTGFGSDTYFISTFKKHLGTSPKKYIKEVSYERQS